MFCPEKSTKFNRILDFLYFPSKEQGKHKCRCMHGYVGICRYEYEEEDEKGDEDGNGNANENVD